MQKINGKQRIIITNVTPEIDCGRFPAKRVAGEKFTVRADIFGDGHDEVKAALLYREIKKRKWEEIPMKPLGNDQWEASFIPGKQKNYEYTIQGWVDHFSTWQHDLKKKFEAGQDVSVELLMGAEMIKKAANIAPSIAKKTLNEWAGRLEDPENSSDKVSLALGREVTEAMEKWGEKAEISTYHKTLNVSIDREKALFSSWYEFFPRSASPQEGKHGTFKDCEEVLEEVARMGFDVVYFPPIHPIGNTKRKGINNQKTAQPGDPGSPWAIGSEEGGHKDIHPGLGTIKDFKNLVKKAKELDLEIALDLAFQCSPDHPYVKEHPQWFRWRPDGTVQHAENPPKKYEDIIPINFETGDWQNLWQELKSIVDHWIKAGVKIFRVDNPHTKPFIFWEWLIGEVKKENPDVIFLSEAFTRPRIMEELAKTGFSQSYTYFTWRNTKQELTEYINNLTKTEMAEYFRPNFWPNTPDILSEYLQQGGEPAFITRVTLAATLSSSYGIYGPVYELGITEPLEKKEEYLHAEKFEIKFRDWKQTTRIKEAIIRINEIRKENPALQQTRNVEVLEIDNPQLFAYLKFDDHKENFVLVVVNLDPFNVQAGWVRIPLYKYNLAYGTPYTTNDLLGEKQFTWRDEWNYVELDPENMPAHIFRLEDLTRSELENGKKKVKEKEIIELETH